MSKTPSIVVKDDLILIKDAVIAYPSLARPETNTNDKGQEVKAWTVTLFLDEDTADEFELLELNNPEVKKFIKGAEAFKQKFKIDPPYPGKKQYFIKVRTNATFFDRKEEVVKDVELGMRIRPSFRELVEGKQQNLLEGDGSRSTKLVANGSVATIAIRKQNNDKYHTVNGKLAGVLVTEMVEATLTPRSASADDPFADMYGEAPEESTYSAPPSEDTPPPQSPALADDFDDDIPF